MVQETIRVGVEMTNRTKIVIVAAMAFLAMCVACGDHQRMRYLVEQAMAWVRS